MAPKNTASEIWPPLSLQSWQDTYTTLHMLTQIVGKIRLAQSPHVNQWWQVALYVTARGLTTSPIPHRQGIFEIEFDFLAHRLGIYTMGKNDAIRFLPLSSRSVAEYYRELMDTLKDLNIPVKIWPVPVEVENPTPFAQDQTHRTYDPDYAQRIWRILAQSHRVLQIFRSRFIGKCSPIHFFWGGFDMAVTRFSGRPAPAHPPVSNVAHFVVLEAYSHEVSSCGFWPGGGGSRSPFFIPMPIPNPRDIRPGRSSRRALTTALRWVSFSYLTRQFAAPGIPIRNFSRSSKPPTKRGRKPENGTGGSWRDRQLEKFRARETVTCRARQNTTDQ